MISQEGQDLIASYEKYGQQLFFPNAVGYTPSTQSVKSWPSAVELAQEGIQSAVAELKVNTLIWCDRW
jgi:hypothetical protein